jgi:hypothetical protein
MLQAWTALWLGTAERVGSARVQTFVSNLQPRQIGPVVPFERGPGWAGVLVDVMARMG